ncbi:MAG: hypothetical protein JST50_06965 [Bacteroidetes bacterium]|jgi:hypothetical protein|nr:hypothetical protein [Bacteroidota bacterium]
MLKASALYIVIIIALVIGVICSALIAVAYFYRAEYQKKFRYEKLSSNLHSGINLLLTSSDSAYLKKSKIDLFGTHTDSVVLQRKLWGIYGIGVVQAFVQQDTLYKTFSIANAIDSTKWAVIYIADDNRPLSVSGKTRIEGNAYLPKAGIQTAYVDGKAFEGDKRLVIGKKLLSDKKLPALDSVRFNVLNGYFLIKGDKLPATDSLNQSFIKPTKILDFADQPYTLSKISLKGNILLHSDTTITLDSTVKLDNILIFAKAIVVQEGFKGTCQLFASDSISVGKNCHLNYPSCLGIIRSKTAKLSGQAQIAIGVRTTITGTLFTWEKTPGKLNPVIRLGKRDTVTGQIYSQDAVSFKDSCVVHGSIFSKRFLYQNSFTLYENYLIGLQLSSTTLSPYYLSNALLPVSSKKKKLLQWLEGN